MSLVIHPLQEAFASLKKGMLRTSKPLDDLERDGCIQRFEYTYELVIKFIQRYLKMAHPTIQNVDQLNFRDLLRVAAEINLIDEVEVWFQFREARNITSHVYDEKKAEMVFKVIPKFIDRVEVFLKRLEQKIKEYDRSSI